MDAAEILFGDHSGVERVTDDRAPRVADEADLAERLYGSQEPRHDAREPEQGLSQAECLFGESAARMDVQALPDGLREQELNDGFTDEDLSQGYGQIRADFSISQQDFGHVLGLINSALSDPPTHEQVLSWERESIARIEQRYGSHAQQLLDDARRMIQQRPNVAYRLAATGMGSHPDVVQLAVEAALRARISRKGVL